MCNYHGSQASWLISTPLLLFCQYVLLRRHPTWVEFSQQMKTFIGKMTLAYSGIFEQEPPIPSKSKMLAAWFIGISMHFWWYFLMLDSQVFPNKRPWFHAELGKLTLWRIGPAQEPLREILSLVLERCLKLYQTMCKGATKTRAPGM